MRMWIGVPVQVLCTNHLNGEHRELHALVGSLNKQKNITGHILLDQLEILSIRKRHDELAIEIDRRSKYSKTAKGHKSSLPIYNYDYLPKWQKQHKIDQHNTRQLLLNRCENCRHRLKTILNIKKGEC